MKPIAHTSGPWHVGPVPIGDEDAYAYSITRPHRRRGLHIPIARVCRIDPDDEANARLIAAAPDLLEALSMVHERWDEDDEADAPAIGRAIRAALDKAERNEVRS